MLWSLFKILVFVAIVAALAFGVQWLLNVSGEVVITFSGSEYVLPPLVVVIGAIAALLVLWVLFKLAGLLVAALKFINGDDTALGTYFDRNRERKGYDALSDSMIALASGDARDAAAKAQKAEKYLNRPEVTTLLVAQASEAAGETERAREAWKSLVTHDRTRFVGVRGLMLQELEKGDTATAMKLAEKAFALKPRHVGTQDTLLQSAGARRELGWGAARAVREAEVRGPAQGCLQAARGRAVAGRCPQGAVAGQYGEGACRGAGGEPPLPRTGARRRDGRPAAYRGEREAPRRQGAQGRPAQDAAPRSGRRLRGDRARRDAGAADQAVPAVPEGRAGGQRVQAAGDRTLPRRGGFPRGAPGARARSTRRSPRRARSR